MLFKKMFVGVCCLTVFVVFANAFPIKHTGQITSYMLGDDAYYHAGVVVNYTRDDTSEIVTDHITGLMWQDNIESETVLKPWITQENWDICNGNFTRQDTSKCTDLSGDTGMVYCENLSLGGYHDWRLPMVWELTTIMDYGNSIDVLPKEFNYVEQNGYYLGDRWIKSTLLLGIKFKGGEVATVWADRKFNIRCTRGTRLETPKSFKKIGDIVIDNNSELMWQDSLNVKRSYVDSINYCENLTLEDFTDWRLPNVNELKSLINYKNQAPSIDPVFQNISRDDYYWSSTTSNQYTENNKLLVSFFHGVILEGMSRSNDDHFSTCVRGGQFNSFHIVANAGPDQNSTIGQQVKLSASLNGDSDANITSYVWKEGDTVLSTDVNFTKSDFTVGTHTVSLTVTDDANNSASDDVLINIGWSQQAVADIELPVTVSDTLQADVEKSYHFTLYEKATLVVDAGETTDVALRGYLYDENGTQVSSMADWSKGKNNQLKIEKTLEAGVYVLKVWGGADGMFSMDVKTYVVDPETPWGVVVKNQYTVHKNKLFTKTFSIQKNIHDANYSNLNVSVAGSTNVRVDVQKKDEKGDDLEEYKYKLVGTLASSEDITLNITDNTQSYSVSLPIHIKVGDFVIKDVGPSNPFIIANGDDITYPLYAVFDAIVPEGSTVKPRCSISIPWDGNMQTIYLPATQIGNDSQRYKCSLYNVEDNHPYYFAPISQMDELSMNIGFDDTDVPYKTVIAPVFKRDILTAKATLEYMHDYEGQALGSSISPYAIVNQRFYSSDSPSFPDIIYLGGEISTHGIRKFNKDTVFVQGGIWKLTYGEHEVIIETQSQLAFTVDGSSDITQSSDVVKFIIDPESTYRMLVKKSPVVSRMRKALSSGILWNVLNSDLVIEECEISNSPLSVSQALDFYNHPCANVNESPFIIGVRGTTFAVEKKQDTPISFHLIEGEIEVSSSAFEKNVTLYDMESLNVGENTKTKLDAKALNPRQAQYLADTSLANIDENTSIGSINVTTNLSNASYILVGDNVQAGNGKVSVFEGVVEGSYKLQFLPVLGYVKPKSINITLNKTSLEKTYSAIYMVDTDNDGIQDNLDAFPNDPDESIDTDGDGIGNNADKDDDNDGFLDTNDDLPLNPNEHTDTDHDGIGNNADTDDDNDAISDTAEIANGLNPLDASDGQADLDHDGFSNAMEISVGTDIRNANSKPVWVPIMIGDIITFVPAKR